jgi:hypothetical protein
MNSNEKNTDIEKMAKDHGMTVDEFKEKSGLKFAEDGSHSTEGHTAEMFSKDYSEDELKELAKQHDMSVEDLKKHIDAMKQHHQ